MSTEQINRIYELIMELAAGNLSFRAATSGDSDELDAITEGINMLAEELQSTTVSKDYLGRIYKGVVDMLIVLNPDYTIREINTTVQRLLGYKQDQVIGKDFNTLLMRGESKGYDKIKNELSKRGHCHNIERIFKTKKGKPLPVSLSGAMLYNDEEPDGVVFIAKDMSKVKKTEHDLRLKNEELNSFIYRVSHDIKGPLSSILGLIYLAKSEAEDVAAVNDYIKLIEQSANRLDNIIADFLELGRLTQSQVRTSTVQVDTLIQEIIKSNQFSPDYAKVQFKIRIDAPGTVKTKVILLKAILQNLIENAVRYRKTNTEAVIQIDVNYIDKDVVIKVSDNGIGMDKNVIEHIFKMFYRGNETSKGSGLGLYIVKTSIDALKGSIDVKSKPGQGSTFTITIPQRR